MRVHRAHYLIAANIYRSKASQRKIRDAALTWLFRAELNQKGICRWKLMKILRFLSTIWLFRSHFWTDESNRWSQSANWLFKLSVKFIHDVFYLMEIISRLVESMYGYIQTMIVGMNQFNNSRWRNMKKKPINVWRQFKSQLFFCFNCIDKHLNVVYINYFILHS